MVGTVGGGVLSNTSTPFPNLPEQTGERMRGGAVSAAVAASTGPRKPAAGARGRALPREKLLHRGQVSRARRFEKFLLLPHLRSQRSRRRRGEKRKTGALDCLSEIPLRPPLFIPTTASYFSLLPLVWRGNNSFPHRWIRLSRSTVPLEEKFRRRHGTSIEQTSSDQSPELRPSLP